MHLRFDAASAVVSAPTSPQGAAQILLRTDRFVSGNRSGARRLAGLGILARRDHGTGTSGGNRLVAFTRVICPISCDSADVLIGRDLVQKFWQHGSITEFLLPTSLAVWRRRPNHLRIKPNRQRSALLQAVIVRRSILGLVLRRGPTAHVFSYHAGFIQ